MQNYHLHYHL